MQYCYNLRNSLEDDGDLKEKIEEADMEELQSAAKDALEWLDNNSASDVGVDAVQDKLKEVEAVVNPIMSKLYQDSGGAEARPEQNPRPALCGAHS